MIHLNLKQFVNITNISCISEVLIRSMLFKTFANGIISLINTEPLTVANDVKIGSA